MAKPKTCDDVFLLRELKLTERYFGRCLNACVALMLALVKQCNIQNINREDCEDMYNEFFLIAVKTYNTERGPFDFYLKKVVEHKTLTVIRRVIAARDPLFNSLSLDRILDNGARIDELFGTKDSMIKDLGDIFGSPAEETFQIPPLDQLILLYKGSGYTIREIAKKLKISMSSVQRRIQMYKTDKNFLKSISLLD